MDERSQFGNDGAKLKEFREAVRHELVEMGKLVKTIGLKAE